MQRRVALVLVLFGAACTTSTTSPTKVADGNEDERGSVGVPPTAAGYCMQLGYTEQLGDSGDPTNCAFPDGTTCEEWSFYRGECGQAHSYCNQHGGSIREVIADAGTFTTISGVCTLNGTECDEGHFIATGKCE